MTLRRRDRRRIPARSLERTVAGTPPIAVAELLDAILPRRPSVTDATRWLNAAIDYVEGEAGLLRAISAGAAWRAEINVEQLPELRAGALRSPIAPIASATVAYTDRDGDAQTIDVTVREKRYLYGDFVAGRLGDYEQPVVVTLTAPDPLEVPGLLIDSLVNLVIERIDLREDGPRTWPTRATRRALERFRVQH